MHPTRPRPRSTGAPAPSRRHLLGAGLVAAGVPLLGGCFGLGDTTGLVLEQPGGDVPEQFKDRQRVVIWSSYTEHNAEVIQANLDAFHEEQDDIFCEVQIFDSYEGVESKLAASLQARQVPDIAVLSDVIWNRFYLAETLEPLTGYFDDSFGTDSFHDRFLAEGTVKDDIWWIPFGRSTPLFYYNREVFAAAGLPDRAPETYTEYAEWGRELAGFTFEGNEVAMRGYIGGDDWYFQGSIWAFGGAYSDGLTMTLTTDESIAALEYDRAFIHDDNSGYLAADAKGDFVSGACASVLESTGSLSGIKEAATFDFGCGFLPREEGAGVPTGGGGLSIMKYASEQRKQAAWEVIKYLSSGEASVNWTLGSGYVPTTKAAMESPEIAARAAGDPNYQVAIDQLEIAQGPDVARRYVPETLVEAKDAIQSVYSAGENAEDVLIRMEKELEPAIDRVREKYEQRVGE
ncbi:ABC transporter substrate-binding protein [Brachybacterium sacelli]|uniref:Sn-glycerol 3-phosphate transport system substrate-binding protein n=1 Tax=Brachybacterium sacelli TaxID=173364 RepID=A0ABS4WZ36_9MICO|nr:ABC transporter substrate-binding protein [Brachybacterium sacelli]MBP2381356.1 sn-glycerol 3-phosphate transport system substrate-binding protein [Brachybacterium sacelli]